MKEMPQLVREVTNDEPLGQVVLVKAVIIYDDDGNYFIHGTNKDDATTMFKTMIPIWGLDPSKEMAQQVEIELELPRVASIPAPKAL